MPATNFGSHASRRAAAVALLLGAAALGCRSSPPPSIVWIVVDTLRADHLTQYGYDRDTSLTLAPLVEDGVRFENAYSPHPETTPAIAAALTGLYPPHNGLRVLYWRLDASNVTAAELLHRAGYETAGFVSSFVMVDDFNGFAQGFDVYDDRVTDRELYRENYERKAAKTVAAARRWLARRDRDKPFFLFVHLIDPHGPYAPPGNWSERFHSQGSVRIRGRVPRYQRIPGVDDLNVYRDRYDGEIAYALTELQALLGDLQRRGELDPALVVFTADHGESMGEHGPYFRHGSDVFQENVHVPLVIKPPRGSGLRHGVRVSTPVSLVDLLPTTLAIAGLDIPRGEDGVSLLPLLSGRPFRRAPVQMCAATDDFATVEGDHKLMLRHDRDGVTVSLYDLAADPHELDPLPVDSRTAQLISQSFDAWDHFQLPFKPQENFLAQAKRGVFVRERMSAKDREDAQRLRSLGYLN